VLVIPAALVAGCEQASSTEIRVAARDRTTTAAVDPDSIEVLKQTLARWLEVQTATLVTRYRLVVDSRGVTTTNQLQYQDNFRARLKLANGGRYSINAGIFTGNGFISGWNNTGLGSGDAASNHYLKQLFFSAKPFRGIEVEFGGLGILRGESTEITTYDNDGYLMGERVSVERPKDLFFDEISVTYAYLGDTLRPNINKRFNRLKKSNYHHFLVRKSLGARAAVSVDYAFQSGTDTMREAIKINARELHVVDFVRFENYQRTDVRADYGFSVYGEKAINKRIVVGVGYADIDRYYGGLNADRFLSGRRYYSTGTLVITSDLRVSAFYHHAVATDYAIPNKSRLDIVLAYDLLSSLKRMGLP
jgi:hypothetical protein